jgi:hypothetical protein
LNDYLISLFIDNEMDLDEKIEFVETVHTNHAFTRETIDLLEQEKLLRENPVYPKAFADFKATDRFSWSNLLRAWWQPAAGFATAMVLMIVLLSLPKPEHPALPLQEEHRFVLYMPQAGQPNLVGTFTDWQPVPMHKVGSTGYWTLTLKVPEGEQRYSYLVENGRQIADPTIVTREHDDFGGENSVIVIGDTDAPLS